MFKKIFRDKTDNVFIVVGLGNFGPEYMDTRHNMGFMAIDMLASDLGISVSKSKYQAYYGEANYSGRKLILVKPTTYMNNSGLSLGQFLKRYKIDLDRLILIYDDVDIEPGQIRVRMKGGAGSHKGMQSVLRVTDGDEFPRVRIGIGKKPIEQDLASYVLGRVGKAEGIELEKGIKKASEAVKLIVSQGIERAMNICNGN